MVQSYIWVLCRFRFKPYSEGVKFVDLYSTANTCAGIAEDGTVHVWGLTTSGEAEVPEMDGNVVDMVGGRFTMLH